MGEEPKILRRLKMAQTSFATVEEIKKAITKLPREELIKLDKEIHKYLETFMMMGAAETAFSEWMDSEEDIYNKDV
jgi:hypothetical protein